MKIKDVVAVIGNSPIKIFPWGREVVDMVNMYVNPALHLTTNDLGLKLKATIDQLSESVREDLLNSEVILHDFSSGEFEPEKVDGVYPPGYIRSYRSLLVAGFMIAILAFAVVMTFGATNEQTYSLRPHPVGMLTRMIRFAENVFQYYEHPQLFDTPANPPPAPRELVPASTSTSGDPATP